MLCQLSYGSRCQKHGHKFSIHCGDNADEVKGTFNGMLWHLHSTANIPVNISDEGKFFECVCLFVCFLCVQNSILVYHYVCITFLILCCYRVIILTIQTKKRSKNWFMLNLVFFLTFFLKYLKMQR